MNFKTIDILLEHNKCIDFVFLNFDFNMFSTWIFIFHSFWCSGISVWKTIKSKDQVEKNRLLLRVCGYKYDLTNYINPYPMLGYLIYWLKNSLFIHNIALRYYFFIHEFPFFSKNSFVNKIDSIFGLNQCDFVTSNQWIHMNWPYSSFVFR